MIAALHGIIAKRPALVSRFAKVNLTDSGYTTTALNWNNINISDLSGSNPVQVSKALIDNAGVSTGWACKIYWYNSYPNFYNEPVSATMNFPSDVASQTWYQQQYSDVNIDFTGLNPSKTYNIRALVPVKSGATYVYDKIVFGGITGVNGQVLASTEYLFSNLSPDGTGKITGNIDSTTSGAVWICGGLIIYEN